MRQKAFSMVELLVVIVVIGLLAAIAIPQFSSYRTRTYDAGALADLRNVAGAEEAYFVDNQAYKSCVNTGCGGILPGVRSLSRGVTMQITATTNGFIGTSSHTKGAGIVCRWNSAKGGRDTCKPSRTCSCRPPDSPARL